MVDSCGTVYYAEGNGLFLWHNTFNGLLSNISLTLHVQLYKFLNVIFFSCTSERTIWDAETPEVMKPEMPDQDSRAALSQLLSHTQLVTSISTRSRTNPSTPNRAQYGFFL